MTRLSDETLARLQSTADAVAHEGSVRGPLVSQLLNDVLNALRCERARSAELAAQLHEREALLRRWLDQFDEKQSDDWCGACEINGGHTDGCPVPDTRAALQGEDA